MAMLHVTQDGEKDTLVDVGCWSATVMKCYETPAKSYRAPADRRPTTMTDSPCLSGNCDGAVRRSLFDSTTQCGNEMAYIGSSIDHLASTSSSCTSSSDDCSTGMTSPAFRHSQMMPLPPLLPRRNTFAEPASGMKDVPGWLKSLRLHKYSALFQQLNYEQMMALNDQVLIRQGVTKGARRKILNCIDNLRSRVPMLVGVQQQLGDSFHPSCIVELKAMLHTPIRAYPLPGRPEPIQARIDGINIDGREIDVENLPAHFTRALHAVHSTVVRGNTTLMGDEHWSSLLHIYDRMAGHEAFTLAQKRLVHQHKSWTRRQWNTMRAVRYPAVVIPTADGGFQCINVNRPPPLLANNILRPRSQTQPMPEVGTPLERMVRDLCDAYAKCDDNTNNNIPHQSTMYPPVVALNSTDIPSPPPVQSYTSSCRAGPFEQPSIWSPTSTDGWADGDWLPHMHTLSNSIARMAIDP